MSFEEMCVVFLTLTDKKDKVQWLLQMRDVLRGNILA